MIIDTISHDEATIQSFMRDPEFAEYYLSTVLEDGDAEEIAEVQAWYDEAKARIQVEALNMSYWKRIATNAELAVKNGHNLPSILIMLNEAAATIKAAMA